MFKYITVMFLLALLLAPAALGQTDNPTVAILRFGPFASDPLVESGILDTLQAYEWINAEERALLNDRQNIEGEQINIVWASAGFDLPTVNIMIEDALDRGADILIALVGASHASSCEHHAGSRRADPGIVPLCLQRHSIRDLRRVLHQTGSCHRFGVLAALRRSV